MLILKQLIPLVFWAISLNPLYKQVSTDQGKIINKINSINTAINLAKSTNDTLAITKQYILLADLYKYLGIDSEAIKNYHLAKDIHTKKDTLSVYANNQIAAIHLKLNKYTKALNYCNANIPLARLIKYKKGLASAYAILGSVYEKQKEYNTAIYNQRKSLQIFKTLNDSTGIALTNENIGSIYEDLELYDLALNYFEKAYDFEPTETSNLKINIINNLADIYRKQKQYNQALKLTEKALTLAKNQKNKKQEESALRDLARTYAKLKNYKAAYQYLNKQNLVNEEQLKQQNTQLVSAMEVLYNVKEKEAQVAILNKQNQINKTQQIAIIFTSLTIILVFIIGLIHLRKQKKQEQQLLTYKQQLLQADLDIKTTEKASLKREIDIKISSLTNYSLNLAHKNKLLADISRTLLNLKDRNPEMVKNTLKDTVKLINSELKKENEWTELMTYFSQINPSFLKNLKKQVQEELTSSEIRLCMLLRLNLSSKAIASILNITPDSVRIARYRMRKKLPLSSKEDLQYYILNI
ncbi:tetratricopeptide repeat protein [Algibacter pectinivorans]|uniref:Tetratricopeptide repeat-containing protein n=1 Tax=Algibacter pectinivorans TaxID=870482 RepID=A0A1I1MPF7_9FLAO|nr:tetratricopeptide repeat protein [Algibacter pectinivorans]SFC87269.1 Tetratricopeptide repeat-containing protein [Algibacter pectinivorans]